MINDELFEVSDYMVYGPKIKHKYTVCINLV